MDTQVARKRTKESRSEEKRGLEKLAPAPRRDDGNIAAMRGFNRFYTRQIGVLRKNFLDSRYTLGEARVLYEIASGHAKTASDIGRSLDLDAGYLSRLLRHFEKDGLIRRKTSPRDARQSHLALTPRGRKAYAALDERSQCDAAALLEGLPPIEQERLIAAMNTIESLLGGKTADDEKSGGGYELRPPLPGDYGWIVKSHAEVYAREYQWKEPFEGLCAQIVADFANKNDPERERCWIAAMNGDNVGCVFLVKDSERVARIRLLLVDPKARGLKVGARLVDECVRFARAAGYRKITLWTHSVLTAARHIYAKAGFKLVRTDHHDSWGPRVVSEHWDLEL
jgi:DNA-binding MarR family transcriptional regulator/N-acetylglutamate synthase-like GNAT family acetyltransferase